MTILRIRPEADRDTDLAADFYARDSNIDVALRFLNAVETAFERLIQHSQAGSPVRAFDTRLAELRFWPVPGFESYLVFYQLVPGAIEIVRVLHGARDVEHLLDESSEQ